MIPAKHSFKDHYKGDTFNGTQFTLTNSTDDTPIDLTGSTILSKFRKDTVTGTVVLALSDTAGITVSDPVNGVFSIDEMIIDWEPATYHYDIEITSPSGYIRTYIKGTIKVVQDITYG